MTWFAAALWTEALKAIRSRVPWLTALGFLLAPLVGGLFMVILQDPERARSMGLISAKAQLTAGTADWPTYFGLLVQATAVGGGILFALVTAWVFGREFSDRTAKELVAVPTPRHAIVLAKFALILVWGVGLTLLVLLVGLAVGAAVTMPGWSTELAARAAGDIMVTALLALALMPLVALWASAGRGYLAPLGWAVLTVFVAQVTAAIGWGAWVPWAVPALYSGLAGPRADQLGPQSYLIVAVTLALGLAATLLWWRTADQTH